MSSRLSRDHVLEIRCCGTQAGHFGRRRHGSGLRLALAKPPCLEIAEEKHFVLDNGAANCSAELVPPQFTLLRGGTDSVRAIVLEEVASIEDVVAEEFPHVAVKLVCAPLNDWHLEPQRRICRIQH